MRLSSSELVRRLIHIGAGFLAFALPWVGPRALIGVAAAGVVFNAWILPKVGGRRLWRRQERESGQPVGIVLYPITVLLLLVLFYRRPEVAAGGWGLLAFGDGFASLVGKSRRGRQLSWNAEKSWAGLLAYWISGTVAVAVLVSWTAPGRFEAPFLWIVACVVSLFGALLESAPQRLDDNLSVPLLSALLLLCLLWTEGGWTALTGRTFFLGLSTALVANCLLAGLGYVLSMLDASGAIVGCLLGTVVFAFEGWQGYLVLLTFFVLGTVATRVGFDRKAERRLAQARRGRRRSANVLANGSVAAMCALLSGLTPGETIFTFAFVGAMAAAAADTVESEIGQLWGRPTLMITTLRRVAPGTDGGVSAVGTLAGGVAACATVGVGWALELCPLDAVAPLALVALLATLLESVAGATLESHGLLDNHGVNFLNTLSGALLGAVVSLVLSPS